MLEVLFIVARVLTIILVVVLIWSWSLYNSLIKKRNQVKTDLSDVNIQLRRKADLIDKLVAMVREYATHEKNTFKEVTEARSTLSNSKGIQDSAKAENMLTQTLRSLMMVVESYPKLEANKSFQDLRIDLKGTEDQIAIYREEYNMSVQKLNNEIQLFPNVLLSNLLKFTEEPLFGLEDTK